MSAVLAPELRAAPAADPRFEHEVLAGLAAERKQVPCTWLYDRRGSELFELITRVPEYYPARVEHTLLEQCAGAIAEAAGPAATLVELGSGASRKSVALLQALDAVAGYVPVDISEGFLGDAVATLQQRLPALAIRPLVRDFTRLTALPRLGTGRRVLFFPGSTIGNFSPDDAVALMARLAAAAGDDALFVVGVDATQDPALLLPAYDDPQGVTAAFNKNLLARINRELDGHFALSAFHHEARHGTDPTRIEMHLVSEFTQQVQVAGRRFHFARGESIHTETAYKHGTLRFEAMARRAGWQALQRWTDRQSAFTVHVFERAPAASGPLTACH